MVDADLNERIRRRAYALWEQEGRPEGHADDHWVRAEAEVAGVRSAAPGAPGGRGAGRRRASSSPERAPSDLAADEGAKGGGGIGP
jgi:Protein of unknown function (DUF2934)